jgi:hypothetical protein
VAVVRVGEPDGPISGVDDYVVNAVEGAAVEGPDEGVGSVGGLQVGDLGRLLAR